MALPVQHAEAHTTTNGTDPVAATSIAWAVGDLFTVVIGTDDNTVPSFVFRNTESPGSITTEDETVGPGANGTVVYKDGTSGSVAYDAHAVISGANVYVWSIKIVSAVATSSFGVNAQVTYGGTSAGSNRRQEIASHTPGSGDSWDTRATRLIASGALTGWATGAGNQTIGSLATTTAPAVLVGIANTGTTSGLTITLAADNDFSGTGAPLSDSFNQIGNHAFYGYYDVATTHRPGATVGLHASGTWGTPNAWAVAVYQLVTPIPTPPSFSGPTIRPPGRVAPMGVGFAPFPSHTGDRQQATPQGIASTNAFGSPTVVIRQTGNPTGIASTNAFGNPTVTTPTAVQVWLGRPRPPGRVAPGGTGFKPINRAFAEREGTFPSGIASTNAFGTPTFTQLTQYTVPLDPIGADAVSMTLLITAATMNLGEAGDIRIALLDNGSVVNTSAFTALSTTPTTYKLVITGTISDPTLLSAFVEIRRSSTGAVTPQFFAPFGLDYTHDQRFVRLVRPPGRVSPGGVGFAPIPHPAREPQYPTVTGIAPNELVGIPSARTFIVNNPDQNYLAPPRPPGKVAPGGLGFKPIPRGVFENQRLPIVGIPPHELVGIPTGSSVVGILTAHPTGIASTNAFGVPTVHAVTAAQIRPTGIAPRELVGQPTGSIQPSDALTGTVFRFRPPGKVSPAGLGFIRQAAAITTSNQTLSPAGIPPTGTYISHLSGAYTNRAGQPYTQEVFPPFGRPTVTLQLTLHPTGIASTNAFGAPGVSSTYRIKPTGIASTNAFGHPSVSPAGQVVIRPTGIASTNRFGIPGGQGTVSGPTGIASTNAFGNPVLTITAQWNVKEAFSHWTIGYPRGRWSSRDPATAS